MRGPSAFLAHFVMRLLAPWLVPMSTVDGVHIDLWRGLIELRHMRLQESILESLGVELCLLEGGVDLVSVHTKWSIIGWLFRKRPFLQEIRVRVKNVTLLAGPDTRFQTKTRAAHIEAAPPSFVRAKVSQVIVPKLYSALQRVLYQLARMVGRALRLQVDNCHIRYETDLLNSTPSFAVGGILGSLSLQDSDVADSTAHSRTFSKLAVANSIALYWDNDGGLLQSLSDPHHGLANNFTNPNMKPEEAFAARKKHAFLIEPFQASVQLSAAPHLAHSATARISAMSDSLPQPEPPMTPTVTVPVRRPGKRSSISTDKSSDTTESGIVASTVTVPGNTLLLPPPPTPQTADKAAAATTTPNGSTVPNTALVQAGCVMCKCTVGQIQSSVTSTQVANLLRCLDLHTRLVLIRRNLHLRPTRLPPQSTLIKTPEQAFTQSWSPSMRHYQGVCDWSAPDQVLARDAYARLRWQYAISATLATLRERKRTYSAASIHSYMERRRQYIGRYIQLGLHLDTHHRDPALVELNAGLSLCDAVLFRQLADMTLAQRQREAQAAAADQHKRAATSSKQTATSNAASSYSSTSNAALGEDGDVSALAAAARRASTRPLSAMHEEERSVTNRILYFLASLWPGSSQWTLYSTLHLLPALTSPERPLLLVTSPTLASAPSTPGTTSPAGAANSTNALAAGSTWMVQRDELDTAQVPSAAFTLSGLWLEVEFNLRSLSLVVLDDSRRPDRQVSDAQPSSSSIPVVDTDTAASETGRVVAHFALNHLLLRASQCRSLNHLLYEASVGTVSLMDWHTQNACMRDIFLLSNSVPAVGTLPALASSFPQHSFLLGSTQPTAGAPIADNTPLLHLLFEHNPLVFLQDYRVELQLAPSVFTFSVTFVNYLTEFVTSPGDIHLEQVKSFFWARVAMLQAAARHALDRAIESQKSVALWANVHSPVVLFPASSEMKRASQQLHTTRSAAHIEPTTTTTPTTATSTRRNSRLLTPLTLEYHSHSALPIPRPPAQVMAGSGSASKSQSYIGRRQNKRRYRSNALLVLHPGHILMSNISPAVALGGNLQENFELLHQEHLSTATTKQSSTTPAAVTSRPGAGEASGVGSTKVLAAANKEPLPSHPSSGLTSTGSPGTTIASEALPTAMPDTAAPPTASVTQPGDAADMTPNITQSAIPPPTEIGFVPSAAALAGDLPQPPSERPSVQQPGVLTPDISPILMHPSTSPQHTTQQQQASLQQPAAAPAAPATLPSVSKSEDKPPPPLPLPTPKAPIPSGHTSRTRLTELLNAHHYALVLHGLQAVVCDVEDDWRQVLNRRSSDNSSNSRNSSNNTNNDNPAAAAVSATPRDPKSHPLHLLEPMQISCMIVQHFPHSRALGDDSKSQTLRSTSRLARFQTRQLPAQSPLQVGVTGSSATSALLSCEVTIPTVVLAVDERKIHRILSWYERVAMWSDAAGVPNVEATRQVELFNRRALLGICTCSMALPQRDITATELPPSNYKEYSLCPVHGELKYDPLELPASGTTLNELRRLAENDRRWHRDRRCIPSGQATIGLHTLIGSVQIRFAFASELLDFANLTPGQQQTPLPSVNIPSRTIEQVWTMNASAISCHYIEFGRQCLTATASVRAFELFDSSPEPFQSESPVPAATATFGSATRDTTDDNPSPVAARRTWISSGMGNNGASSSSNSSSSSSSSEQPCNCLELTMVSFAAGVACDMSALMSDPLKFSKLSKFRSQHASRARRKSLVFQSPSGPVPPADVSQLARLLNKNAIQTDLQVEARVVSGMLDMQSFLPFFAFAQRHPFAFYEFPDLPTLTELVNSTLTDSTNNHVLLVNPRIEQRLSQHAAARGGEATSIRRSVVAAMKSSRNLDERRSTLDAVASAIATPSTAATAATAATASTTPADSAAANQRSGNLERNQTAPSTSSAGSAAQAGTNQPKPSKDLRTILRRVVMTTAWPTSSATEQESLSSSSANASDAQDVSNSLLGAAVTTLGVFGTLHVTIEAADFDLRDSQVALLHMHSEAMSTTVRTVANTVAASQGPEISLAKLATEAVVDLSQMFLSFPVVPDGSRRYMFFHMDRRSSNAEARGTCSFDPISSDGKPPLAPLLRVGAKSAMSASPILQANGDGSPASAEPSSDEPDAYSGAAFSGAENSKEDTFAAVGFDKVVKTLQSITAASFDLGHVAIAGHPQIFDALSGYLATARTWLHHLEIASALAARRRQFRRPSQSASSDDKSQDQAADVVLLHMIGMILSRSDVSLTMSAGLSFPVESTPLVPNISASGDPLHSREANDSSSRDITPVILLQTNRIDVSLAKGLASGEVRVSSGSTMRQVVATSPSPAEEASADVDPALRALDTTVLASVKVMGAVLCSVYVIGGYILSDQRLWAHESVPAPSPATIPKRVNSSRMIHRSLLMPLSDIDLLVALAFTACRVVDRDELNDDDSLLGSDDSQASDSEDDVAALMRLQGSPKGPILYLLTRVTMSCSLPPLLMRLTNITLAHALYAVNALIKLIQLTVLGGTLPPVHMKWHALKGGDASFVLRPQGVSLSKQGDSLQPKTLHELIILYQFMRIALLSSSRGHQIQLTMEDGTTQPNADLPPCPEASSAWQHSMLDTQHFGSEARTSESSVTSEESTAPDDNNGKDAADSDTDSDTGEDEQIESEARRQFRLAKRRIVECIGSQMASTADRMARDGTTIAPVAVAKRAQRMWTDIASTVKQRGGAGLNNTQGTADAPAAPADAVEQVEPSSNVQDPPRSQQQVPQNGAALPARKKTVTFSDTATTSQATVEPCSPVRPLDLKYRKSPGYKTIRHYEAASYALASTMDFSFTMHFKMLDIVLAVDQTTDIPSKTVTDICRVLLSDALLEILVASALSDTPLRREIQASASQSDNNRDDSASHDGSLSADAPAIPTITSTAPKSAEPDSQYRVSLAGIKAVDLSSARQGSEHSVVLQSGQQSEIAIWEQHFPDDMSKRSSRCSENSRMQPHFLWKGQGTVSSELLSLYHWPPCSRLLHMPLIRHRLPEPDDGAQRPFLVFSATMFADNRMALCVLTSDLQSSICGSFLGRIGWFAIDTITELTSVDWFWSSASQTELDSSRPSVDNTAHLPTTEQPDALTSSVSDASSCESPFTTFSLAVCIPSITARVYERTVCRNSFLQYAEVRDISLHWRDIQWTPGTDGKSVGDLPPSFAIASLNFVELRSFNALQPYSTMSRVVSEATVKYQLLYSGEQSAQVLKNSGGAASSGADNQEAEQQQGEQAETVTQSDFADEDAYESKSELRISPLRIKVGYRDMRFLMTIANDAWLGYSSPQLCDLPRCKDGVAESEDAAASNAQGTSSAMLQGLHEYGLQPVVPNRWYLHLREEQSKHAFLHRHDRHGHMRRRWAASVPASNSSSLTWLVDKVELSLVDDSASKPMPMVSSVVSLTGSFRDWSSVLNGRVTIGVIASYFNHEMTCWEPLLEPIRTSRGQLRPWIINAAVFKDLQDLSGPLHVSLRAYDRLELTASPRLLNFSLLMLEALERDAMLLNASGRQQPPTTVGQQQDAPFPERPRAQNNRLRNHTGLPLLLVQQSSYDESLSIRVEPDAEVMLDIGNNSMELFPDHLLLLRGTTATRVSVGFVDGAWKEVEFIPVDKVGIFTFEMEPVPTTMELVAQARWKAAASSPPQPQGTANANLQQQVTPSTPSSSAALPSLWSRKPLKTAQDQAAQHAQEVGEFRNSLLRLAGCPERRAGARLVCEVTMVEGVRIATLRSAHMVVNTLSVPLELNVTATFRAGFELSLDDPDESLSVAGGRRSSSHQVRALSTPPRRVSASDSEHKDSGDSKRTISTPLDITDPSANLPSTSSSSPTPGHSHATASMLRMGELIHFAGRSGAEDGGMAIGIRRASTQFIIQLLPAGTYAIPLRLCAADCLVQLTARPQAPCLEDPSQFRWSSPFGFTLSPQASSVKIESAHDAEDMVAGGGDQSSQTAATTSWIPHLPQTHSHSTYSLEEQQWRTLRRTHISNIPVPLRELVIPRAAAPTDAATTSDAATAATAAATAATAAASLLTEPSDDFYMIAFQLKTTPRAAQRWSHPSHPMYATYTVSLHAPLMIGNLLPVPVQVLCVQRMLETTGSASANNVASGYSSAAADDDPAFWRAASTAHSNSAYSNSGGVRQQTDRSISLTTHSSDIQEDERVSVTAVDLRSRFALLVRIPSLQLEGTVFLSYSRSRVLQFASHFDLGEISLVSPTLPGSDSAEAEGGGLHGIRHRHTAAGILDDADQPFIVLRSTVGGEQELTLGLHVPTRDEQSGSSMLEIDLYAPYWIINKTGLPLSIGDNPHVSKKSSRHSLSRQISNLSARSHSSSMYEHSFGVVPPLHTSFTSLISQDPSVAASNTGEQQADRQPVAPALFSFSHRSSLLSVFSKPMAFISVHERSNWSEPLPIDAVGSSFQFSVSAREEAPLSAGFARPSPFERAISSSDSTRAPEEGDQMSVASVAASVASSSSKKRASATTKLKKMLHLSSSNKVSANTDEIMQPSASQISSGTQGSAKSPKRRFRDVVSHLRSRKKDKQSVNDLPAANAAEPDLVLTAEPSSVLASQDPVPAVAELHDEPVMMNSTERVVDSAAVVAPSLAGDTAPPTVPGIAQPTVLSPILEEPAQEAATDTQTSPLDPDSIPTPNAAIPAAIAVPTVDADFQPLPPPAQTKSTAPSVCSMDFQRDRCNSVAPMPLPHESATYEFAVSIALASHQLTKIVTIEPRWIIMNETGMPLLFRRVYEHQDGRECNSLLEPKDEQFARRHPQLFKLIHPNRNRRNKRFTEDLAAASVSSPGGDPGNAWGFAVRPGETVPLHWPLKASRAKSMGPTLSAGEQSNSSNAARLLSMRLSNVPMVTGEVIDTRWSAPFGLEGLQSMVIVMYDKATNRNVAVRMTLTVKDSSMVMVFTNTLGMETVRVENHCPDLPIRFWQPYASWARLLEPGTAWPYALDLPLGAEKLCWATDELSSPELGASSTSLASMQTDVGGRRRASTSSAVAWADPIHLLDIACVERTVELASHQAADGTVVPARSVIVYCATFPDGPTRVVLFTQDENLANAIVGNFGLSFQEQLDRHGSIVQVAGVLRMDLMIRGVGLSLMTAAPRDLIYMSWRNLDMETWISDSNAALRDSQAADAQVASASLQVASPTSNNNSEQTSVFPMALLTALTGTFGRLCLANTVQGDWRIGGFQIDSQLPNTQFPTILAPRFQRHLEQRPFVMLNFMIAGVPAMRRQETLSTSNARLQAAATAERSVNRTSAVVAPPVAQTRYKSSMLLIPMLRLSIAPLAVKLDELTLVELAQFCNRDLALIEDFQRRRVAAAQQVVSSRIDSSGAEVADGDADIVSRLVPASVGPTHGLRNFNSSSPFRRLRSLSDLRNILGSAKFNRASLREEVTETVTSRQVYIGLLVIDPLDISFSFNLSNRSSRVLLADQGMSGVIENSTVRLVTGAAAQLQEVTMQPYAVELPTESRIGGTAAAILSLETRPEDDEERKRLEGEQLQLEDWVRSQALKPVGERVFSVVVRSIGGTFTKVNDADIRLQSVTLSQVLCPAGLIAPRLLQHYNEHLLRGVYRVLGSFDVLGNPANVLQCMSAGVRALVNEPIQAYRERDGQVAQGVRNGAKDMTAYFLRGSVGAVARVLTSLAEGLEILSFDPAFQARREGVFTRPPTGLRQGLFQGGQRLLRGFIGGAESLTMTPIRRARQDGPKGLLKGLAVGTVGGVVKPVLGILDFTTGALNGLVNVRNIQELTERVRLPRHVHTDGVIRVYSEHEAEGAMMLQLVDDGRYQSAGRYISHVELEAEPTTYRTYHLFGERRKRHVSLKHAGQVAGGPAEPESYSAPNAAPPQFATSSSSSGHSHRVLTALRRPFHRQRNVLSNADEIPESDVPIKFDLFSSSSGGRRASASATGLDTGHASTTNTSHSNSSVPTTSSNAEPRPNREDDAASTNEESDSDDESEGDAAQSSWFTHEALARKDADLRASQTGVLHMGDGQGGVAPPLSHRGTGKHRYALFTDTRLLIIKYSPHRYLRVKHDIPYVRILDVNLRERGVVVVTSKNAAAKSKQQREILLRIQQATTDEQVSNSQVSLLSLEAAADAQHELDAHQGRFRKWTHSHRQSSSAPTISDPLTSDDAYPDDSVYITLLCGNPEVRDWMHRLLLRSAGLIFHRQQSTRVARAASLLLAAKQDVSPANPPPASSKPALASLPPLPSRSD